MAPQAITHPGREETITAKRFMPGDHVSWNSEAGVARGRIIRIVTSPTKFKGYTVHASSDEPQYEIKSDTTDHIAMHKGSALTKLRT
jgi:hypothetical protein